MLVTKHDDGAVMIVTLEIPHYELVRAEFDDLDRLLFEEAGKSYSVADQVLALEAICRKIEESKGEGR